MSLSKTRGNKFINYEASIYIYQSSKFMIYWVQYISMISSVCTIFVHSPKIYIYLNVYHEFRQINYN